MVGRDGVETIDTTMGVTSLNWRFEVLADYGR